MQFKVTVIVKVYYGENELSNGGRIFRVWLDPSARSVRGDVLPIAIGVRLMDTMWHSDSVKVISHCLIQHRVFVS